MQSDGVEGSSQLARLANALRTATEAAVSTDLEGEELDSAISAIEAATLPLEGGSTTSTSEEGGRRQGIRDRMFRTPFFGSGNPLTPPMTLEIDNGVVHGTVRFGLQYVGPPGLVNGGVIAALFDQILGAAAWSSGHGGVTGTLTTRFRRPTPLDADLTFEARHIDTDGRKVNIRGWIYGPDGEICAEAEGIWIRPKT